MKLDDDVETLAMSRGLDRTVINPRADHPAERSFDPMPPSVERHGEARLARLDLHLVLASVAREQQDHRLPPLVPVRSPGSAARHRLDPPPPPAVIGRRSE
jgi:hypothetical protein